MKIKMALTFIFLILITGCNSKKQYITKEEYAHQCVDACVEGVEIVLESK